VREPLAVWIGKDEHLGLPSLEIPDRNPPPHWRLADVAATQRPRHLDVAQDGRILFIWDTDTSDIYSTSPDGGMPYRHTVDRELVAYWEDDQPRWSPDGSSIAYTDEGVIRVVAASGGPPRTIAAGHSPVWYDEGRLLAGVEEARRTRLVMIDLEDPFARPLTSGEADFGQLANSDAHLCYVVYPVEDRYGSEVVLFDPSNGKEVRLSEQPGFQNHSPTFHPSGRMLAFCSERTGRHEIYLVDTDGSSERRLTNAIADFGELSFSADGRRLAATRTNQGRTDLVLVDVESGKVDAVAVGGSWAFPRWLPSGDLAAVYEDYRTPPRIETVSASGRRTVIFEPAPATVRNAPYVQGEHVWFPSFDGTSIPGWLHRPANGTDRVPAVVYLHGGPTDHYGDHWDGYAQYFLDKGYGWFGINVRGSTSYGLEFERSNHARWGVDDTADCLAAYDYLASLDWIDPNRVAVFGPSYGAYVTLCAVTDDARHRFVCGAMKYGDCDLLTSWAQTYRAGRDAMERTMPRPNLIPEAYRASSPIHRVSQITAPLLICHGELDDNVVPEQSEELVAELRRLGKTFEYLTYPTEGHGLLRRGPQLHFYQRLERFLDWYLLTGRI